MARDITTHGDQVSLGSSFPSVNTIAFWYKPTWNSAGFVGSPQRRALMGGSTVIGGTTYHVIFQCEKNFGTVAWNVGQFVDGTIASPYDVLDDSTLHGTAGFCVAGQWVHFAVAAGLFYVNGVVKNISNGSVGPPALDGATTTLGLGEVAENQGGSPGSIVGTGYADGTFAELTYWSDALGASEIAALAGGVSPASVRPTKLTHYWPLWGTHSPEINLVRGASSGTLTGTSRANGPPIAPFMLEQQRAQFPYTPTVSGVLALSPLKIDVPLLAPTSIGGVSASPSPLRVDMPLIAPPALGAASFAASPLKADLPLVGPTPTGGGLLAASPLAVQIPLAIAPQAGGILSLSPLEWDVSLLAPTAASAGDPLRPGGGRLARAGNVGTFRRASARGGFARQELAAGGRFAHAGQTGTLDRAGAVGRLERKCLP
jgi:hypothetical protein